MAQFQLTDDSRLFAISKSFGRHDEVVEKKFVNPRDIIVGQQLINEQVDEEEFDNFLDSLEDWEWATMLGEAFKGEHPKNLVDELNTKGYISLTYEEGMMGVGFSKELAYVGYVESDLQEVLVKGSWDD